MGFPEQGQANSVAFAFRVRFTAVALSVGGARTSAGTGGRPGAFG
jgi:hypothetical protein